MEQTTNPTTIADNLSEKPRRILRAFEDHTTRNTNDITTETDYSNADVGYHAKSLINHGVIRDIGYDEDTKLSIDPKEYRLTPLGQEVIDVFRQREAETEAEISQVDAQDERIDRLEKENEQIRERLEEVETRLDTHKKAMKLVKKKLDL